MSLDGAETRAGEARRLRMTTFFCVTLSAVAILVAGCAGGISPVAVGGDTATAELRDASGQPVGQATFTEVKGGVRIVLEARNLPPGEKGVHLHAVGKCEPPQFTSAGAHFNPQGKQHGILNPAGAHAGDLPNITIGPQGTGRLESFTDAVTLGSGANSLLRPEGTAIVVHAAPDDFRTDPTGNSGARIACGVLTKKPS